jgi:hypothetical protein
MSVNIPSHYVIQFSTNLQLLLQQRGSKLRDTVTVGNYVGEAASPVDQVGAVTATPVVDRFASMHRVDAPVDRRWVYPQDYDLPQLIDSFDKLRLLTDPNSTYAVNANYAMGRAMDDEIIASYFRDAKTGKQGGTTTTFGTGLTTSGLAIDHCNVSVGIGGAASGLNVPKLREAKRSLMADEVDLDFDPLVCIVKSTQHDNLLGEVQVVSADFGWKDMPVLKEGRLERFLGINFKHCERLTTGTDDAAGTSTQVPVYAKSGMHLGIWNEIQNHVDIRADIRSRPYQLYSLGTFGGARLEEKKVRRIWCR